MLIRSELGPEMKIKVAVPNSSKETWEEVEAKATKSKSE